MTDSNKCDPIKNGHSSNNIYCHFLRITTKQILTTATIVASLISEDLEFGVSQQVDRDPQLSFILLYGSQTNKC